MNNIFIALSTHHVKYCEKIAQQQKKATNILITSRDFEVDKTIFDRLIYLKSKAYNQSDSTVSKIKTIIKKASVYKDVVAQLRDLRNKAQLRVYFSSLEDMLSNHMLFYFSRNIEGVVIEDGVLNYYMHTLEEVSQFNFLVKRLIALAYGIKIKPYIGHTSGIDYDKVKYQLVRQPNFAIKPEKSRQLPQEKRKLTELSNNNLIVGQEPYGSMFGSDVYISKLKKLLTQVIGSDNYSATHKIYYKPHRHGPRLDFEALKRDFKNHNLIYVDDDTSMEDLYFDKLKCRNIYTFDSSAVFSIYSEAPLQLKEQINITVMPFYKSVLNPLFKKLNFTIIENDL